MSEIDQSLKAALGNALRVVKDYDEGGFLVVTQKNAFIKYNTGDCIWFTFRDGAYHVSYIETDDDHRIDF